MQVGNIAGEKITSTKKRGKSASGNFSVGTGEVSESEGQIDTGKVNISSLWMLQSVQENRGELDMMQNSCSQILEELKELRLGLINGEISGENLQNLSNKLSGLDIQFESVDLQRMLDEVKLRAEVELAKYVIARSE